MIDIVGKIWGLIFGTIFLFLGPITLYAQKQDVIVQNYVDSAVHEFVDISRSTGTVTWSQYDALVKKLDNTGNIYDVQIIHYKMRTTPKATSTGTTTTLTYQDYYDAYNKNEILDGMDANGKYYMSYNDYFKVTIENTNTTLGRRLLGVFMMRPTSEGGQIFSSFGGKVGND